MIVLLFGCGICVGNYYSSKIGVSTQPKLSLLHLLLPHIRPCWHGPPLVDTTTEGIYLRTRSGGTLFNLARLRAKTKVRKVLIRDMLFADVASVATHAQEEL